MRDTPRNRDGSLDRWLRAALAPPSTPRVAGPCLDAETVAAWTDGTLTAAEQSAAEAHAAHCARCQALVASVVRMTPSAPPAPRPRRFAAAWLVPVTAALAAALVWGVMSRGGKPTERAPRGGPPVDRVASASPATEGALKDEKRLEHDQSAPPTAPEPAAHVAARRLRSQDADATPQDRVVAEPVASPADVQASPQQNGGRPPRDGAASFHTKVDQSSAAPAAAPPSPAAEAANVPGVAGSVAGRAEAASAAALQEVAKTANAARKLVAPTGPVKWRIGPGGSVQRSIDGGSSWQPEQPGVDVLFAAVSSPSPTVCWLVGARGTVLLWVDGRAWQRIEFPETVDLVSVRAINEWTATVTTADGRTFITSNRGANWVPMPAR